MERAKEPNSLFLPQPSNASAGKGSKRAQSPPCHERGLLPEASKQARSGSMTMTGAPATGAGVPIPPQPISVAATAGTVPKPAPAPLSCAPRIGYTYTGVRRSPSGQWAALVFDPSQGRLRVIGLFPDEHAAALAHDRVAIFLHGDRARVNFGPAFHCMERVFLRQARQMGMDVCGMVAGGAYEAQYASFLRLVFAQKNWDQFIMDVMIEFYLDRVVEIGKDALVAGGEMLADKFVEMHRNKSGSPVWRAWHARKAAELIAERRLLLQKQQEFMEMKQNASNNSNGSTVVSGP